MSNPFTLMFGKIPYVNIRRDDVISDIVLEFDQERPSTQSIIIIGARGAGKTVLLAELYNYYDKDDSWIVADINPHRNILEDLASNIYEKGKMKHLFLKTSFNFSFHGLGFSINGDEEITSINTILEKMFESLKKQNKKVLITIDEVVSNDKIREFVHDFQTYIRKDYPIYFIGTGLYENISSLQNDKSLTFLYRAKKILLKPIDLTLISKAYKNALDIDEKTALQLAILSNGYGYGFQLLGYLFYEHKKIDDYLLNKYDDELRMNSYNKIYSTISENEKKILNEFIKEDIKKVADILKNTGFNDKNFSVYRDRLIQKGVLISPKFGYLSLALPRFKDFLKDEENTNKY